MLSGLERELELYMGEEYEDGGPAIEPQLILTKVGSIKDSNLTNKPGPSTPVEITFVFRYDRIYETTRLSLVFKRLDTNYTYELPQYWRLKSNSSGTRIEGEGLPPGGDGITLLFEVKDEEGVDPGEGKYLSYRLFWSAPSHPLGFAGRMIKDDMYIFENENEAKKFKNMFIKLLKEGHIGTITQGEFEFDNDEFELEDIEEDRDVAYEYDYEDDEELEDEFEYEYELQNELNALEDDGVTEDFARRLHELSMHSFESEYELDMELDSALDVVENEFMVKRLRRKRKKGKRKGLFKKILNTGAKIVGKVAGRTPIGSLIKAGTSLVRRNVKGTLGNQAKAAVGTALGPVAGTAATAATDAPGGGEGGEISRGGRRRRAIRRMARIARDTYREVADTLPDDFDHPLVANEVARKAVRKAMVKHGVRPPGRAAGAPPQRRVIQLKPGEKVLIVG
jgi:hypothetical protein